MEALYDEARRNLIETGQPLTERAIRREMLRLWDVRRAVEEARAQAQREAEEKLQTEEREFVHSASFPANFEISPALKPPPTNFRVRIRRANGQPALDLPRDHVEARLRQLKESPRLDSAERIGAYRSTLAALDAALLAYATKQDLPPRQELRYLRYDRERGTLRIYSDVSPTAKPEAVWNVARDGRESLSPVAMRVWLRASGRVVCFCADVPPALRETIADAGIEYVRGTERSANARADELLLAARLGERQFEPGRAELLDGLPSLRLGLMGLWDAWRMNLKLSDRLEWRKFRSEVKFPKELPSRPATASAVRESLAVGHKDILLVVAHNDGRSMYLPSGEKIPLNDFASLKRAATPDRVVMLLTCKGAIRQGGLRSLAEMILQNRLARAVFASELLVDATQLPDLLHRLKMAPSIRSALGEFQFDQYVENLYAHPQDRHWLRPGILRPRLPRG